jgi:uncharacterized protein YodC (DUF2158 family)
MSSAIWRYLYVLSPYGKPFATRVPREQPGDLRFLRRPLSRSLSAQPPVLNSTRSRRTARAEGRASTPSSPLPPWKNQEPAMFNPQGPDASRSVRSHSGGAAPMDRTSNLPPVRAGDRVRLKSGGPVMTVERVNGRAPVPYSHCSWMDARQYPPGVHRARRARPG